MLFSKSSYLLKIKDQPTDYEHILKTIVGKCLKDAILEGSLVHKNVKKFLQFRRNEWN
jgi:hypothetical protein